MAQALMNYLDPGAIVLGLKAATDQDVIRILADRLESLGYIKPSFAEAVIAREARLPTGLPLGGKNNVAVPHTDPVHVLKPGLALATLVDPVPFSNMEDADEKLEVKVVFLMALNDKDMQIEMLQEIAGTIQSPEVIAALIASKSVEDVSRLLG
ncbi:PTS sugar transporter subunit IIA [Phyllobacterium endophyticum]|uniref:PTS sugar transporter subunit IIA n=1 Tax=Phyllobacterium endophyticum TaxID=1149773 RepID=A0A2P7AWQ7_9HYPH|nr:PTS sugar transporter subunit IIA [Phyllobacterium endophyticum]MBB3235283.1 PTS system galactitol-specific IIA component [Phyllobacterium endophyticum]PSH58645.1 PTS sugar transporter subunit IIA [Phyllobacterium endophyticum]TYR39336.1 PTS sugar transporter subunit IIA [Phyllobacterium endophyticum]